MYNGGRGRGIAESLCLLSQQFLPKKLFRIKFEWFFFFLMKIKFLFKVVAFVETNSTKRFETNRVRSLKRILKTFSIRLSMLDSIEGENMELRLVLGIISGSNEEIEEIWKILSTTFNLIPSYRRNLSSVWMHTHKRTYWYRSSQHFTIWTRPYFKEEKQFRESSLRSVKNEVERKTSATEMSLSDAINDSRETGWFSRQMDAFVPRISNVSLVPTCRLPTRR